MSRRLKQTVPTVSLFPFLAVLLCTMGILVMMLVIAVKSAEVQAAAQQEQQSVEIEAVRLSEQQRLDDAEVKVMGWSSIRPELIENLRQAREMRRVVEQTLVEFEEEQRQIFDALSSIANDRALTVKPAAESEAEIAQIQSNIEALNRELATSKSQPASPTLYSVVPFDGPGGTHRRPIYVECTAEGVILQPHGIRLGSSDFLPPLGAGNPLDAALLTIRDYWRETDQANDQGSPYPLLVVRSDGAPAYNMARRAMTSWVDEFGYELIDKNLPLDFGSADPALATKLNEVIQRAKRDQIVKAQAAQEFQRWQAMNGSAVAGGAATAQGLMPDRVNGGFTRAGGRSVSTQTMPSAIESGGATDNRQPGSNEQLLNSSVQQESDDTMNQMGSGDFQPNREQSTAQNSTSSAIENNSNGNAHGPVGQNSTAQSPGDPGGNQAMPTGSSMPSLAEQRGANWALPNRSDRGTAYLRPIRVVCDDKQISLNSTSSGELKPQMINWQISPQQTMSELVQAVWREMDQWGIAAANGYWKPELRIRVLPGGERRFQDIQQLMDQSGFSVVRD